jgi:small subunit ribosomal protein S1
VVKGRVRNIADFGIFVEIEEGIDGLVHISDMSWTQRVKHPSEMYQKGDEVEAAVLNIDTADGEKPKISLGIKQLIADPWDRIPYDYPVGKIIDVKVLKVLDFGAFVELERGVEGLVHVSEISEERIEDPRTALKPGEEKKAQIITVDPIERKIGLSIRGATRQAEMADAQGYSGASTGGATLGDVMRAKLSGEGAAPKKKGGKGGKKQRPDSGDDYE